MAANERTLNQIYDEFSDVGSLKDFFYDWHGLNEDLFFSINSFHDVWYDQLMLWITTTGNHKLFLYYLAFFGFYAVVSTLARKLSRQVGLKAHMAKWFGIITVLIIGYGSMGIAVKTIKTELAYPRPYVVHGINKVEVVQPQATEKGKQSFPSGHAAFIAFMLTALWPALGSGLRLLGITLVLAVAYSRVALGIHFPADVVGGVTFGFIITLFVRVVLYSFYRKFFKMPC